jgi:hypothetical protein
MCSGGPVTEAMRQSNDEAAYLSAFQLHVTSELS